MAAVSLVVVPLQSTFGEALVWSQEADVLVLPLTPTESLGLTSSRCVLVSDMIPWGLEGAGDPLGS